MERRQNGFEMHVAEFGRQLRQLQLQAEHVLLVGKARCESRGTRPDGGNLMNIHSSTINSTPLPNNVGEKPALKDDRLFTSPSENQVQSVSFGKLQRIGNRKMQIAASTCEQSQSVPGKLSYCAASEHLSQVKENCTGPQTSISEKQPRRQQQKLEMLPLWERDDGRLRQYAWDGRKICLVDSFDHCNDHESPAWSFHDRLQRSFRQLSRIVKSAIAPRDVDPSYWSYVRWKSIQRTISSLLQVHATQSLLLAVGVGAKRTLPTAAGLTWVLKDGLGRLGRLSYTAAYGRTFDCHLKRVRFGTSVLFTASLGLEMLTPLAPRHFLPLATLANVGKSISLAAYLATTPAVHKTFALVDNLADISAKGQAQTVVADNLGLALAMILGAACRNNERVRAALPLAVFPALAVLDVFAIQQELRAVPLRSLNKERLEMVAQAWLKDHQIPSAEQISQKENLFFPDIPGRRGPPLHLGPIALQAAQPHELRARVEDYCGVPYVLSLCRRKRPFWLHKILPPTSQLVLSLREDAKANDVMQGVLQASHFRVLTERAGNDPTHMTTQLHVEARPWLRSKRMEGFDVSEAEVWEVMLRESRRLAERDLPLFMEELRTSGWHAQRILLTPREQQSFSTEPPEDRLLLKA